MSTNKFTEEADEYGDLYTLNEFATNVVLGAFIPSDGFGLFGTETHYSFDEHVWGAEQIPEGATHVHWFNK